MQTLIVWVTDCFEAWHRWSTAPDDVAFLRNYHRHLFHVRLGVEVGHGDREVEFFQLKRQLATHLTETWAGRYFEASCEMIAQELLDKFTAAYVEVSEDGENGAAVVRGVVGFPPAPQLPSRGTAPKRDLDGLGPVAGGLLPSQQTRTRCFVGTEAEGPNRGKRMLFVPGRTSPQAYARAYRATGSDVWGVYYGAGNDRCLRADTMAAINVDWADLPGLITLEVDRVADLPYPISSLATVVSLDPADVGRPGCSFIKVFSGGSVYWLRAVAVYNTALDDPLFSQDEEVAE